jgi:aminocarboxymuconate-semialdehyde decarboxylase
MSSIDRAKDGTTRRDFFKKAAVGATGVAVAGALGVGRSAHAQTTVNAPGKDKKKIDVFCHICPERYLAAYAKKNKIVLDQVEARSKATTDIDYRMKVMDRFPDVLQLLTISNPPLDRYLKPDEASELAKIGNDELAEILIKYPDKFIGAVACVSWNNIDAAMEETDRAIRMGFKGIQITTRVAGEPIDQPQFKQLYEKMANYDLPIWIHPVPYDKLDQDTGIFSWPFETSMAMHHLVSMGIFLDYPNIKFIAHHCGAMVPYFEKRIHWLMTSVRSSSAKPAAAPPTSGSQASRPSAAGRVTVRNVEEHFRKFYVDTAVYGNTNALMCGYNFYGADHLLFGTDAHLGPAPGLTGETIASVEQMDIPGAAKEKIFTTNAVNLLRLAY